MAVAEGQAEGLAEAALPPHPTCGWCVMWCHGCWRLP